MVLLDTYSITIWPCHCQIVTFIKFNAVLQFMVRLNLLIAELPIIIIVISYISKKVLTHVRKQLLHRSLQFYPLMPCASSTHIVIPDLETPTLHVYDWETEEVGQFTAHQLGLEYHDAEVHCISPMFNGQLSLRVVYKDWGPQIITYKVEVTR